ncbi:MULTISPECIES: RagB/SusD family nutrient uptake outer membrane protein [Butyricimonas]|uniref:RagB/SusD family nutrient uptake outer membrane protein n=1 Tax=Butyricimonas TaxID=574697 RepID=UPI001D05D5A0|nr:MULTISPECIES: RagB/SusD family nutrient uptake outer membrane protein [Butyricimonas]MCB6972442.1 RagB/SusD family nutrient uptake outer membrane protein [Butyricimonas synergistica]MCG4519450.1 RagB/SusD family nutrient uptake outer membrane protein [Butyricimonas sp. DFI.6.44]
MRSYIFIILLFSTLFLGCESFLSEVPDDRTELKDVESIKALLVSAYPEGHYMLQGEWMSDNADDKGTWQVSVYPQMQEEAYKWEENTTNDYDSPTKYWDACYRAIAAANHALEAIDNLGNTPELQPYRGEALVARAYAHFMLVNFWGKHYNPATMASDLGVAYVEKPEKEALVIYTRNTVKEVYEFIERDLTEGLPLLRDNAYDVAKYHFTKAAGAAFAARYYLYRGDSWDKVQAYCTEVLGEGTGYKDLLRNYTQNYLPVSSNVIEYMKLYTNYGEPAILLLTNGVSIWWRAESFSRYGLSLSKKNEIFPDNDPVCGGKLIYPIFGAAPTYVLYKSYEYFKNTYPGSTTGRPYVFCVAFSMEEVALNRAEAYTMTKDYDKALADINLFLSTRITSYNPTSHTVTLEKIKRFYGEQKNGVELEPWYKDQIDADQMLVLKYITDLKRREFCSEGMRWFDVKRFNIEVTHKEYGTQNKYILTKDDPRRLLQVPVTAVSYGMEPNPR